jgi:hypothetical protein
VTTHRAVRFLPGAVLVRLLAPALASTLAACATLGIRGAETSKAERPPDIARTEPGRGEDEPTRIFDEKTRQAKLAERFPGAHAVDLVRFLAWTDDASGACHTEMAPAWETKVDARYRLAGKAERTATSFGEMKDQGWLAVYRSPNGKGLERRGSFESIDLTLTTEYVCRCPGSEAPAEKKVPLRVRLRWQGKGKMPEVSGAIVGADGKKEGQKVVFAAGSLLTYEVPFHVPYPAGGGGSCGGVAALYVLASPPML